MVVLKAGPAKTENPAAVYYPAHRWHDAHDFTAKLLCTATVPSTPRLTERPCWQTVLTLDVQYRFRRLSPASFSMLWTNMIRGCSGCMLKRTALFPGRRILQNTVSSAQCVRESIFVADGHLYVFNEEGRNLEASLPERPACLLASADGTYLAVTARGSLYAVKL